MLDQVSDILEHRCRLLPGQTLLVAVSGGPDSLCLLHLLINLNYRLFAAHFDHSIRPESSADARAVELVLRDWDIDHFIEQADVPQFARQTRQSLEEAARSLRYEFLFRQAQRCQADAVLTGHNADDQVETFLMHLLRGSGLAGLRGMQFVSLPNPWSDKIPLIRPLLGTWRQQIMEYILANGLKPLDDPTNRDVKYYRNRIRRELGPVLESYNPQYKQRIWQTSHLLDQDYAVLTTLLENAWSDCIALETAYQVSFNYSNLRKQPETIQRYLLKRAAFQLVPGLRDVDYQALARASKFIQNPSRTRQVDWIAGLRLWLEADLLSLARWGSSPVNPVQTSLPYLSAEIYARLPVPGVLDLRTGWMIETRVFAGAQAVLDVASKNQDPYQAWMNGDRISAGLSVRTRRSGDRIKPLGLAGHSLKLSDLMINAKVPAWARSTWPVVLAGDEIAWVPGLRLAEPYRLTEASSAAIYLKIYPV